MRGKAQTLPVFPFFCFHLVAFVLAKENLLLWNYDLLCINEIVDVYLHETVQKSQKERFHLYLGVLSFVRISLYETPHGQQECPKIYFKVFSNEKLRYETL